MGMRAPGTPQAPKAPLPEFAAQRKKVEQRINADTQGQQDALQRRFAAQGMLNSGAAIKQQNILANQAQQNREDALGQVDAAEMGEMQRRQEILDNRDFMSNESKLGRDFQSGESALSRAFQAGESKLGRDLQSNQFDRSFTQSANQFDKQFGADQDRFEKQFGADQDRFEKQFGLESRKYTDERGDQEINIGTSIAQMDDKTFRRFNDYRVSKGLPPLQRGGMRSSTTQEYYDNAPNNRQKGYTGSNADYGNRGNF